MHRTQSDRAREPLLVAIPLLQRRLARQDGFTLIELLVVIVILGILVVIAVPSYLSFRTKAAIAAAKANVSSAIPAAESYYTDTAGGNGSYNLLTGAKLRLQSPGVDPNATAGYNAAKDGYCIQDAVSGQTYSYTDGTNGT